MPHVLNDVKHIFLAALLPKLFVLMINLVNQLLFIIEKKIIKKHFNKSLIMPAEDEERFQLSNKCWLCNKSFDVGDNKVRDHCHITGKYRGSAHWSCNIDLRLAEKIPVMFHYLRGYDSYLTMQEISRFDGKVNVLPDGLEKYMAFTINNNLVFVDSMQFMNSTLDALVKNLSDNDFKYSPKEFSGDLLGLVKQNGVCPDKYMHSLNPNLGGLFRGSFCGERVKDSVLSKTH